MADDTPRPLEVQQIPVPGHPLAPQPLKSEQIPLIPPDKLPDIPIEKIPTEARPQPSLAPDTTRQQDITTAGQRTINLIWELTQAAIAVMVTGATIYVAVLQGIARANGHTTGEFPIVLTSAFFLIIGAYFSRTNHAAIGGVGRKPIQQYEGR